MTERVDTVTEALRWVGSIPLHYEYTAGVVGEKFLRGLMDGKILAGYCPECRSAALPARMYCVDCYAQTSKLVRAGPVGTLKAVTRGVDATGQAEAFGFVQFPGVKGGMVHRVIGSARVGSKVRARFRPKRERTGAISDVVGFERAG